MKDTAERAHHMGFTLEKCVTVQSQCSDPVSLDRLTMGVRLRIWIHGYVKQGAGEGKPVARV